MSTPAALRGGLRLASGSGRGRLTAGAEFAGDAATIELGPLPEQVILPLQQHSGPAARPVVRPGDAVLRGQLIGSASSPLSCALHSPISGRVRALEVHPNPLSSTLGS